MKFRRVSYADLNSRQKEDFNFQKVSAVLADYGFVTLRLNADWQGADFIAQHVDGELFLKVQLKGRAILDTKYKGKDIWICFRHGGISYLYPHDEFLLWALENTNIGQTKGWLNPHDIEAVTGRYSWPSPSRQVLQWLANYSLTDSVQIDSPS